MKKKIGDSGNLMQNSDVVDAGKYDFIAVGPVDELPDGECWIFDVEDLPIVVFNIGGDIFAIADTCSHDGNPLGDGEIEDHQVICPRHGARFDLRNGKALSLPAVVDIPTYPIRVLDDQIVIGIPLKR